MSGGVAVSAAAEAPFAPAIETQPRAERIHGIDVLRGLVMVLMALDHARDYFGDIRLDPTNMQTTTPALFATRWVTHFCAPVFVFLAGTSAYLHGRRLPSRGALAGFLASRGVWLIFLEVVVVTFAWKLAWNTAIYVQVIWAIGFAMLCLAALVFLPVRVVGAIGLALVAGQHLLESVNPPAGLATHLWTLLYVPQRLVPAGPLSLFVMYPLLPWLGVIALGYGAGPLFERPRAERRGVLLFVGLGGCVLFALLRATNLYGEPSPWSAQGSTAMTIASFLNCTKYPPSLCYLAMTLGPALVLLALIDREPGWLGRRLRTFGRVPLFYYVAHLFALSAGAAAYYRVTRGEWFRVMEDVRRMGAPGYWPADYGNGLATAYVAWALAVLVLYPPCAWYARVKRASRSRLMSYL